ncbi:MAG TPA: fused MFS/spermidine synthase [Candidatus Binatia bacterium]|nr:fused MFS/spermidine synthase [Candidatus Binatia bacterium]
MAKARRAAREQRRPPAGSVRREREGAHRAGDFVAWVPAALAAGFVLSGAAGLMHEVVWTRLLGHVFGVSSYAIATVLAAYMGGLAFGSFLAARRTSAIGRPQRAYAALELAIAACAAAIPLALRFVEPVYAALWRSSASSFAASSAVRFALASAILLVPTSMMGATLPVLAEACARRGMRLLTPDRLYTANLAGAVLGAAAAGFAFMPSLGVWGTIAVGCALNAAAGALVWALPEADAATDAAPDERARGAGPGAPARSAASARGSSAADAPSSATLGAAAFASGLLSLGTQVAWNRVLVLVVGSTTYAFTSVLVVYLVALGLGSALATRIAGRAAGRPGSGAALARAIAIAFAASAVLTVVAVWIAGDLPALYHSLYSVTDPRSLGGLVTRGVLSAAIAVFPPVLAAGTILPLVLAAASLPLERGTGAAVGRVYAVNTLGSIAGSLATGFLLVPVFGSQATLLGFGCVAGAGAVALGGPAPRRGVLPFVAAGSAVVAAAALALMPGWNQAVLHLGVFEAGRFGGDITTLRVSDAGQHVIFHREGRTASVVVVEFEDDGVRSMRIDARTNASDGGPDMHTQVLLAQLPFVLGERIEDVLVVGWGSGVTVGSVLASGARSITAVELEPAVVAASELFARVNGEPLRDPRVHLVEDDARHVLLSSQATWDAIVSEPSHPFVAGVASLFTREFFELAARRLRPDGVFVQWVQTYGMPLPAWRSVLATFLETFPEAIAFWVPDSSDVILVGSRAPLARGGAAIAQRWLRLQRELARAGIDRPEHLAAAAALGTRELKAIAAGATPNTDDNMLVEFEAAAGSVAAYRVRPELEAQAGRVSAVLPDGDPWLDDPARRAELVAGFKRVQRNPRRHVALAAAAEAADAAEAESTGADEPAGGGTAPGGAP